MRQGLTITTGLLLALVLPVPTAVADPVDCEVDHVTGNCTITVPVNPPTQPNPNPSPGTRECVLNEGADAGVIDCESDRGVWSNERQCYVELMEPPPPAGDPMWEGNDDGAVYWCSPYGAGAAYPIWLASPPDAGPTPEELAWIAIARMNMRAIDIGIVPEPGQGRAGLVGLPTWMWVDSPTVTTAGPITESAGGGGITVTATARVNQIEWDMGDGNRVTCTGHGTPYRDAYGAQSSPDCGHRYEAPGTYQVTARSLWVVEWAGGGQSGTITLDPLERSTQIVVDEMQVLIQR
ncbi:hypothetical protein [Nocardioides sp.]|uniref:hypothetical protein n=1 Tax=Nocardioides sp. TaxID=35761 RepID=UPI0027344E79|nr:hypothetical protein [Nocardioides sp.]MDP3893637.1 hypothetical protein [Nocardioides sp.]